jgi:putative endopeptidase
MVRRAAVIRSGTVLAAVGLAAAGLPQPVAPDRYLDQFIDRRVSPREDFFHYAVGKWLREHPIPRSEASWGVGNVVREEVYRRLLDIPGRRSGSGPPP